MADSRIITVKLSGFLMMSFFFQIMSKSSKTRKRLVKSVTAGFIIKAKYYYSFIN